MQIEYPKKMFWLLGFFLFLSTGLEAKTHEETLQAADSLFFKNRYSEAADLYEQILNQEGRASAGMLLKMAFIYDRQGNVPLNLYYLSLYYLYSPNTEALIKMQEVAAANRLKGYEHADIEFLRIFYNRYFEWFAFGFILSSLALFILLLSRLRTRGQIPIHYGVVFILIMAAYFYLLNFMTEGPKGIIKQDNTYLMSAPSAGASLTDILKAGQKISILEQKDIWVKVVWEGQIAYVRADRLLLIKIPDKKTPAAKLL